MNKTYHNILVRTPKYKKILIIMSIIIIFMCALAVGLSYYALEKDKPEQTQEQYQAEQAKFYRLTVFQGLLAFLVTASMIIISESKKRTRILVDPETIQYHTVFNKVIIPWSEIKDVKVKMAGSSLEKCTIRNHDGKRIVFNGFMTDASDELQIIGDSILDKYGNPYDFTLRKGKLFKEVSRYYERNKRSSKKNIESKAD